MRESVPVAHPDSPARFLRLPHSSTGRQHVKPQETQSLDRGRPELSDEANQALVLCVPDTALVPDGSTFYDGPDDKRCRLIKPDGERCKATRVRRYGLCSGHAGTGGIMRDPAGAAKLANAERRRRSAARVSLGISARRAAQPLQQSRMQAQLRANEVAAALIDAPLDDPEVGTIPRQQAMIRAMELLYPQVHASLDMTLPDEPEQLGTMGWQEMQALAQQLVTSSDQ